MYAKPSELVTTTAVAVTVLMAGGIFISSNITTAAYGSSSSSSSHRNENNFCFTTSDGTGSFAAASSTIGTNALTTTALHCYDNMGACKKTENQFVNDGTTVIGIDCTKNLNIATG